MTPKVNLGASIAARLLKQARETGDDVRTLLTRYCPERFLVPVLDDLLRGTPCAGTGRSGGPWRGVVIRNSSASLLLFFC